jgi:hypothetical protein
MTKLQEHFAQNPNQNANHQTAWMMRAGPLADMMVSRLGHFTSDVGSRADSPKDVLMLTSHGHPEVLYSRANPKSLSTTHKLTHPATMAHLVAMAQLNPYIHYNAQLL